MADTPSNDPIRPDVAHLDAVETILAKVLAAPPAERSEQIAQACCAHPTLAGELARQFGALLRLRLLPAGDDAAPSPSDAAEPAAPTSQIGPFRLGRRLGGGGMGVVHEAVEVSTQRRVALKLLRPELQMFGDHRQRFEREIAVIGNLDHPGIVPLLQHGTDGGVPWYAMALVAGRSLAAVLADLRGSDPRHLTPDRLGRPRAKDWVAAACDVVRQIALALAHAHQLGVVHRDIKPANVMLADDGRVLLIDFGLAHAVGHDSLTRSGVQPGSLAYMSPEQIRGEPVDQRTDVFSLGVVFYELLALRPAFLADTEARIRANVIAASPPPLRQQNSRLPWETAVVCATAMAPERSRRYASAQAFADDLLACLDSRPIAARSASTWLRCQRFVQRRPALSTGLALGFLLATVVPSTFWLQEARARQREQDLRTTAETAQGKALEQLEHQRQLTEFAAAVFRRANPMERTGRVDITVREALDETAAELDGLRSYAPLVEASIRMMVVEHYRAMGRTDQVQPHLERAWELRRQHLPADSLELGDATFELGRVARDRGHLVRAEELFTEALRLRRATRGPRDPYVAQTLVSLGVTQRQRELFAAAEATYLEAMAIYRERLGEDHENVVQCLGNLAGLQLRQGRLAEAEANARAALRGFERIHGDRAHYDVEHQRFQLGHVRCEAGVHDEGLAAMQAALARMRQVLAGPHPRLVAQTAMLGKHLTGLGRHDEAEALLREGSAMTRELRLPSAEAEVAWADLMLARNHPETALELLQERLQRPLATPTVHLVRVRLAQIAVRQARFADAQQQLELAWASLDGWAPAQGPAAQLVADTGVDVHRAWSATGADAAAAAIWSARAASARPQGG